MYFDQLWVLAHQKADPTTFFWHFCIIFHRSVRLWRPSVLCATGTILFGEADFYGHLFEIFLGVNPMNLTSEWVVS